MEVGRERVGHSYHGRKKCKGCIATYDANSVFQGFVSQVLNICGEYSVIYNTTDILLVSLDVRAKGPIDIETLPNFAFIGATAPNSPPTSGGNSFTTATGTPEDIESAIWTIGHKRAIIPQWVNMDKSKPATNIVLLTVLWVLTGDVTTFENTFVKAEYVFHLSNRSIGTKLMEFLYSVKIFKLYGISSKHIHTALALVYSLIPCMQDRYASSLSLACRRLRHETRKR
ncbi:hypothetical protein BC937DRAFT_91984 [Endogone sp. FLAS-F59071]|nr:hypothetical protein BC937DRAFT_91984 [Endogone sp. FLAS-F59071]|eukprot:RUS15794.1 hypothetical protein BC937DRAFT_91984 [Endogone sp. FLAS-F59071]